MEDFALYLLKSAAWLTGFTIVYYLFLRKERFFILKRVFLVTGILISVLFPLITLNYTVELPARTPVFMEPVTFSDQLYAVPQQTESEFNYLYILAGLYLAGIILMITRHLSQLIKLLNAIRKSKKENLGTAMLIRNSEFTSSFSFFNYVFVNPSVSGDEVQEIMNHELVHVNQKHWFDLVLGEFLRVLQWTNPFAWIYARFIRLNHEYLADEVALQRSADPALYKAALLNQLFRSPVISISNPFNYSITKTRFDMMKKIVSSPYRKLKVLTILPVFAIILYAFARPEYTYAPAADAENGFLEITGSNPIKEQTATLVQPPEISGNTMDETDLNSAESLAATQDRTILQDTIKGLVVIDGIEMPRETLREISPDAIESITVLKEISAVKEYGEKGRNGVIIIKLKQQSVKGIVRDQSGKPLEGVQVTSTGTLGNAFMVTTDKEGLFNFERVQVDARLLFMKEGYKRLSLTPDLTKTMEVTMEPGGSSSSVFTPLQADPLVAIDGVITDKQFREIRKELGHSFGTMQMLQGKAATDKYGEQAATRPVADILTRKKALEMGLNPPYPRIDPEDFPTFMGKKFASYTDWAYERIRYPEEARAGMLEGWVFVNFTVENDGSISNITAQGDGDQILKEEVLRVVKSMPKFEPPKNPEATGTLPANVSVKFVDGKIETNSPYVVVEEMPMFPGGDAALLEYIKENAKYPEHLKAAKTGGRVIVRFIVNTKGGTEGISVLKGVHPELDAEAIRVVSTLKDFKPGTLEQKPVNVWYMVPITFTPPEE